MNDEELRAYLAANGWDKLNQFVHYGDVVMRTHILFRDKPHEGHTHPTDHCALILHGSVKVRWVKYKDGKNGGEIVGYGVKHAKQGDILTIDKGICHDLIPEDDFCIWACIFANVPGHLGDAPFFGEVNDPYSDGVWLTEEAYAHQKELRAYIKGL